MLFLFYVHPPAGSLFWDSLFDTGHILIFGLLSILFVQCSQVALRHLARPWHFVLGAAGSMLLGLAVEVWQLFTPDRTFETIDLYSDLIGVLAFPLFYAAYGHFRLAAATSRGDRLADVSAQIATDPSGASGTERRSATPSRKRAASRLASVAPPPPASGGPAFDLPAIHRRRAEWRAAAGLVILFLGLLPFARLCLAYVNRAAAYPVLLDFSSRWPMPFLFVQGCQFRLLEPPPAWNSPPAMRRVALFDCLPADNYPGIMYEPVADWRNFDRLVVDLFWDSPQAREMVLRVHDKYYGERFEDRFNRSFIVRAGWNQMVVPLDDVRRGPRDREIDLSQIDRLGLFVNRPHAPVRFALGRITLENGESRLPGPPGGRTMNVSLSRRYAHAGQAPPPPCAER